MGDLIWPAEAQMRRIKPHFHCRTEFCGLMIGVIRNGLR